MLKIKQTRESRTASPAPINSNSNNEINEHFYSMLRNHFFKTLILRRMATVVNAHKNVLEVTLFIQEKTAIEDLGQGQLEIDYSLNHSVRF